MENYPGSIRTPDGLPVDPHLAIDLARPRFGDPVHTGAFEDEVRLISEAAAPSPLPDPDPRMGDPVVGVNTRMATHPFWATVRKGFEDIPLLGQKGPERSPHASPDPLQSMEASPNYHRSTFRTTPGPWDESLLIGG